MELILRFALFFQTMRNDIRCKFGNLKVLTGFERLLTVFERFKRFQCPLIIYIFTVGRMLMQTE